MSRSIDPSYLKPQQNATVTISPGFSLEKLAGWRIQIEGRRSAKERYQRTDSVKHLDS